MEFILSENDVLVRCLCGGERIQGLVKVPDCNGGIAFRSFSVQFPSVAGVWKIERKANRFRCQGKLMAGYNLHFAVIFTSADKEKHI